MVASANAPEARPAAVAGLFYPARSAELAAAVDDLLQGPSPSARAPKALIVPHAGYVYSGRVAGRAFRALKPAAVQIRRVVLIGPSHREWFRGLAVPRAQGFQTPLGMVPIDRDGLAQLAGAVALQVSDAVHAREHSLEVQLPFVQRLLPAARIVPILVGDATPDLVDAAIEAVWGGAETVIIVSSDLSHYHSHDEARDHDAATARAILDGRGGLTGEDACGCIAVDGLLGAVRRHGLHAELIDLRTSGDTAGDRDRVVGYGAFGFYDA
jgi:hypothetical protein